MKRMMMVLACFFTLLLTASTVFAENEINEESRKDTTKKHLSFRDPLDNAFDVSDWIINYNGFIPMPLLITEPALGGFGGGVAPIFIKQRAPIENNGKIYPTPPDITAAGGIYTLNNTWAVAAGRTGSIPKWGLRYRGGAAYANVNMAFYHTFTALDNKEYEFDVNMRVIPAFIAVSKIFKDPRWSVELSYMFMNNKLKLDTDLDEKHPEIMEHLNEFLDEHDIDNVFEGITHNLAHFGLKGAFDSRDNTFTPNKGIKAYITAVWNSKYFGGDYNFGQFEGALYWFIPITKKLINGFRLDMQQAAGDKIPFYVKPFIDMRGIPAERYQGKTTMLMELEERWDFYRRWSLLAFGGIGKAFDDYKKIGEADLAYSYGIGGRYLIARRLNLRMGVDLAMGPEGFTYYLVFGSSWLRQ